MTSCTFYEKGKYGYYITIWFVLVIILDRIIKKEKTFW